MTGSHQRATRPQVRIGVGAGRPARRLVALVIGLGSILGGVAYAQRTAVSELWREWEGLHAEWRAERAVFEEDRAFNARLRARRSE